MTNQIQPDGSTPIETVVVDGLDLANELRDDMREQIEKIVASGGRSPCLVVVLVGEDPASRSYIKGKQRACGSIGTTRSGK